MVAQNRKLSLVQPRRAGAAAKVPPGVPSATDTQEPSLSEPCMSAMLVGSVLRRVMKYEIYFMVHKGGKQAHGTRRESKRDIKS